MMYRVTVEKGYLSFSAAHFISYMGKCERLHGHNYGVSLTLEGELTEDAYVFDFVELKRVVRRICDSLDHRFLLPAKSEELDVRGGEGSEWEIRFEDRRYVLPAQDVLSLPIDNITAERLAEYVCEQFLEALAEYQMSNLTTITVGVEEAEGQTAYYVHRLTGEGPH